MTQRSDMKQYLDRYETEDLWAGFKDVFNFRHGVDPDPEENQEEYQYFIAGNIWASRSISNIPWYKEYDGDLV